MGYMPYTTNPHMPKVRMQAAKLVLDKSWSTRQAALHTGFNQSTISRWVERVRLGNRSQQIIPTESSKPHNHPRQLADSIVKAILDHRHKYGRCAEAIHYQLRKEGYLVSLSSVKRTLKRNGLTYPSKWKKWHQYPERPIAEKPGILVQIDTMWEGERMAGFGAYALLDTCSRWAYAEAALRINSLQSARFVKRAQKSIPYSLQLLQSDHGSEFTKYFTNQLQGQGVAHRHSRVRQPTDNGHIERFIRTLQQECLRRLPRTHKAWQKSIPDFIHYYNTERPHMGLNMKTPLEVMRSY